MSTSQTLKKTGSRPADLSAEFTDSDLWGVVASCLEANLWDAQRAQKGDTAGALDSVIARTQIIANALNEIRQRTEEGALGTVKDRKPLTARQRDHIQGVIDAIDIDGSETDRQALADLIELLTRSKHFQATVGRAPDPRTAQVLDSAVLRANRAPAEITKDIQSRIKGPIKIAVSWAQDPAAELERRKSRFDDPGEAKALEERQRKNRGDSPQEMIGDLEKKRAEIDQASPEFGAWMRDQGLM